LSGVEERDETGVGIEIDSSLTLRSQPHYRGSAVYLAVYLPIAVVPDLVVFVAPAAGGERESTAVGCTKRAFFLPRMCSV